MYSGDIDPVEEIRAIRRKHDRRFKTMDEYWDHLKTIPSADVLLARVREKIAKAEARKVVAKPARRPASRRLKTPIHA